MSCTLARFRSTGKRTRVPPHRQTNETRIIPSPCQDKNHHPFPTIATNAPAIVAAMCASALRPMTSGVWRRTLTYQKKMPPRILPGKAMKKTKLSCAMNPTNILAQPAGFWIRKNDAAQSMKPGRKPVGNFRVSAAAAITIFSRSNVAARKTRIIFRPPTIQNSPGIKHQALKHAIREAAGWRSRQSALQ